MSFLSQIVSQGQRFSVVSLVMMKLGPHAAKNQRPPVQRSEKINVISGKTFYNLKAALKKNRR
jgi:hypothetical protein